MNYVTIDAFAKLWKMACVISSTWDSLAAVRWIFMQFYIWGFC